MNNKEIELEGKILLNALENQRSKIAETTTELDQKEVLEQVKLVKTSNTEELVQHAEFLRNMEHKLREYSDNVFRIEKKRVKMFFLGLTLSVLISVGASVYGASYMIKTFPTRVVINTPENIILYDSSVSLWGLDKTRVLKELRKNDTKNSKKY